MTETEQNHCKDCCCARAWKALGVTEYTGKDIPDYITDFKTLLTASESENAKLTKDLLKSEVDRAFVREFVTGEIAAHGDCQCEASKPCVYCASIAFNESTTPNVVEERLKELKKDKERLDWLDTKAQDYSVGFSYFSNGRIDLTTRNPDEQNAVVLACHSQASLRQAIDSAIAKEGK